MLLYARYRKARRTAQREWRDLDQARLMFTDRARHVRVQFLVDYYPVDPSFGTEAGVSYLVSTDRHRILFDLGFNPRRRSPSPLESNLHTLGLETERVDGVFISHNHLDHVGGLAHHLRKSPALEQVRGMTAGAVPIWTSFAAPGTTDCEQVSEPREVLPALASTGPLPAPLYVLGLTREQALLVALRNRGLVLITGCGHPGVVEMVRFAEQCTGERVFAVVGGLHLIAEGRRTRIQKYLGANRPPWALPGKRGVRTQIERLKWMGVEILSPSAHDSCDASLRIMREVFGDGYVPLRAGGELRLDADG